MKILWKRGEMEQFLFFSTIFFFTCCKIFMFSQGQDFHFDKRFFEISEVEITRVNYILILSA